MLRSILIESQGASNRTKWNLSWNSIVPQNEIVMLVFPATWKTHMFTSFQYFQYVDSRLLKVFGKEKWGFGDLLVTDLEVWSFPQKR